MAASALVFAQEIAIKIPAVADPAIQLPVLINLQAPYPLSLVGRLSLSFSANTTGPAFDDPAVLLIGSSGEVGRSVLFRIPSGTTSVRSAILLTGTVAGSITLTITQLSADGQPVPLVIPISATVQIPRLPPILTVGPCGSSTDPSVLNLTVSGFSTTRDVTSAVVITTYADGTQQSANLDLKSLFEDYFGRQSFFGGQFMLTIPLILRAGTSILSVDFTLTNSVGPSSNLPGSCVVTVQRGLSFRAVAGAGAPSSQAVRVFSGALDQPFQTNIPAARFTTGVTTASGGAWLKVSPDSGLLNQGQSSSTLQISVDPSDLNAGNYYGQVQVVASGAPDPQLITVVLNLLDPDTAIIPEVAPLGLVFTLAGPTSQAVGLSNPGTRAAPFTTTGSFPDGVEFTVTPSTGVVQAGQSVDVQIQPNSSLLQNPTGVYRGTITFTFPEGGTEVNVLLIAPVGGSVPNASINQRPAAVTCVGTRLLPQVRQLGLNFLVSSGWPGIVQVEVRNDCGELIDDRGGVNVDFSNGDSRLPLRLQPDDKWLGTWTPLHQTSRPVQVTITAKYQELEGIVSVNALSNPNQDTEVPVLDPEGVLNAATRMATAPAPGERVSILGGGLANTEDSAASPLPFSIRDTRLTLSGRSLPLAAIKSGDVSAIIPYSVPVGAPLMLTAKVGAKVSVPISVRTKAADPAILSVDASESGQAQIYVIKNSGDLLLVTPDQPASKGDVLLIRCSGLGAVEPQIDAGVQASGGTLPQTVNPLAVTIGDITVSADSAGLSTSGVGVYEVKVLVPDGIQPGDKVPVSLTVTDRTSGSVKIGTSPSAMIAVR